MMVVRSTTIGIFTVCFCGCLLITPDTRSSIADSRAPLLQAGMYRSEVEELLGLKPSTANIRLRAGKIQDESWRFSDGSSLVLTFECIGPSFPDFYAVLRYEGPFFSPEDELLEWRGGSNVRK